MRSRPGYLGCGGDNNPNMSEHMCPKEKLVQAAMGRPEADEGDGGQEMSPEEVLLLIAVINPDVYRQM